MNRMPRTHRPLAAIALAAAAAVALSACGASSGGTSAASGATDTGSSAASSTGSPSTDALSGTVTVLAAASLTESLTNLAKDFEQANPGVKVRLSFGSSTTLAQQITQGAEADIFASAGEKALDQLPADKRTGEHVRIIATNSLEIATPPGNPAKVTGLASLADKGVNVVLCAPTVPCGSAADTILKKAGINAHVVSRELDVKATLAKVTLGEADAAVVYVSDVKSAGDNVQGVQIPAAENTTLKYPLVMLSTNPAATAFAQLVLGEPGRSALTAAGFATP